MTSSSRVKVIEFFSVPGAGKSTLVEAISSDRKVQTRSDLVDAWQRAGPASKIARVAGAFVNFRLSAAAVSGAVGGRLSKRESLARMAKLVAKSRLLASQRGSFVLDQAMLQELWSIHFASGRFDPDVRALSRLLEELYKGLDARIVFIDLDPATAAERIGGRSHGDSRLDGLPVAQAKERLERAARLPQKIIEAARAAGLAVTTVDGKTPRESLAEELKSLLPADANNGAPQKKTVVDMAQAEALAHQLGAAVGASSERFDAVVGIANGGVHPAFHVADELGLPLHILRVERNATRLKKHLRFARRALSSPMLRGPVRTLNRFVDRKFTGVRTNSRSLNGMRSKRVLLVDDCIDSGASVALARSLLEKEGAAAVKTAVLCWTTKYDSGQMNGVTPDFFLGRRLPSYPWSADNPDFPRFRAWLSQQS